ncbi:arginase family protein, partial [Paraburkholderia sp. SIMBA_050]
YSRALDGVDVAISGVPLDLATTYRSGARLGPAAIRAAKRALRADLPGYAATFRELEGDIARQVDAIRRTHAHGRDAIPVLRFAEIANGAVEPRTIDAIR